MRCTLSLAPGARWRCHSLLNSLIERCALSFGHLVSPSFVVPVTDDFRKAIEHFQRVFGRKLSSSVRKTLWFPLTFRLMAALLAQPLGRILKAVLSAQLKMADALGRALGDPVPSIKAAVSSACSITAIWLLYSLK